MARPFYGWVVVGIAFLVQFVASGSVFYSFGIYLKPLAADLGATRFEVGRLYPMLVIVTGIAAPFIGRAADRGGARRLLLLGATLLSLGLFGLSRVESLLGVFLAFGIVMALGHALLGGVVNQTLIANWFVRRRGTALGVAQLGVSMSGMVMALVTSALVTEVGWRATIASYALVPLVLLVPLVALGVVNRPEDRGLAPDGEALKGRAPPAPPVAPHPGITGRILRQRVFWLLAGVIALNVVSSGSVIQLTHSHATDLGYSHAQAATILSLMAGMAALGKPLFGTIADRFSKRGAMAGSIVLQVVGLLLLLRASSYLALLIAAFVFGLGLGGVITLWGVLVGAIFGRAVFGRVMGMISPVLVPFNLLGLPYATWMFDRTGSYAPAFATYLGFYAVAGLLLAALRIPERPPELEFPRA